MAIYQNTTTAPSPAPNAKSNVALKGLLVDGAIRSGQVVLVIKTLSPAPCNFASL